MCLNEAISYNVPFCNLTRLDILHGASNIFYYIINDNKANVIHRIYVNVRIHYRN